MKKISLLTAALFTSTIAAATAQMAVPVVPAAPCPPALCPCPKAFQGFSLGGNFGYGIGAVRKYTVNSDATSWDKTKVAAQGFDGGLTLGYNYVFTNKFGLGLDVYFNWASTSGSHSSGNTPTIRETFSLKNAIQVRVPFSYVICNLVAPKVYVGWDNARWSGSYNQDDISGSKSARYNGFLWGAGVDFLLAKHVISGLEYTGVISQNKTLTASNGTSVSVRPMYNTVKATLKFIY
jgi:opacity protein-like surface antigen